MSGTVLVKRGGGKEMIEWTAFKRKGADKGLIAN